MLITGFSTWTVAVSPGINWIFLRVNTDTGLHGWGEATLEGKDHSAVGALDDITRDWLNQPVPAPEVAWRRSFRGAAWKGAALYTAMSAFDQALWDLRGKAAGMPVHYLLGGPVRERIHTYTWAATNDEDRTLDDSIRRAHETWGYTHFKMAPLPRHFTLDAAEEKAVLEQIEQAATALPPEGKLAVEGHQRLIAPAAVRLAKLLEPYPVMFVEDLVNSDDEASMLHLRQHTSLPIVAGEKRYTRWHVWPLLRDRLVDYLSVDLCHAGAISEGTKIASAAEMVGIPLVPHNPNGPIGMAATLQLAAAHPNVLAIESVHQRFELFAQLTAQEFPVADGYTLIPTGPGLGVELDVDALDAMQAESASYPFDGDFDIPSGRL